MPEIFVSLIVVGLVVYGFYWLGSKLNAPLGHGVQIVALAGGFLWLLMNVRALIAAITSL